MAFRAAEIPRIRFFVSNELNEHGKDNREVATLTAGLKLCLPGDHPANGSIYDIRRVYLDPMTATRHYLDLAV